MADQLSRSFRSQSWIVACTSGKICHYQQMSDIHVARLVISGNDANASTCGDGLLVGFLGSMFYRFYCDGCAQEMWNVQTQCEKGPHSVQTVVQTAAAWGLPQWRSWNRPPARHSPRFSRVHKVPVQSSDSEARYWSKALWKGCRVQIVMQKFRGVRYLKDVRWNDAMCVFLAKKRKSWGEIRASWCQMDKQKVAVKICKVCELKLIRVSYQARRFTNLPHLNIQYVRVQSDWTTAPAGTVSKDAKFGNLNLLPL